ncbi:MAG: hypothetical protein P1V20_29175 [Verrucomicrobiales bacterium]|nr:hypothetical protein [Verrucomicrobiales bacterium]
MEMIVVVGLVSALLAFVAPNFINLMPNRKAQISEISSFLEMARARAIATRQDIYVVFGNENFPEPEYRYRAYSMFASVSSAEEARPIGVRELIQVDRWEFLTADMVFAKKEDFSYRSDAPLCVMDSNQTRVFEYQKLEQKHSATLPYLLFNKTGRVEVPNFQGKDIHVGIIEGVFGPGGRIVRSGQGDQVGELLLLSPLTGKITPLDR